MNDSQGSPRSFDRTVISVTIEILDRWSVAGPADLAAKIDLPSQADPRSSDGATGHIPGTSLAGSLKAHLAATADAQIATAWLGEDPPGYGEQREASKEEPETPDKTYHPGALSLLGIAWEPDTAPRVTHRGSTAIDLETGAAKDRTLRTEQHAGPATFTLHLEHDGQQDAVLLGLLASWVPVIGRGRSVGMGQASVRRVRAATCNLRQPADLTWWLTDRHEWPKQGPTQLAYASYDSGTLTEPTAQSAVLDVTWVVKEPIHIGFGPSEPKKPAETLRRTGKSGPRIIPGSSWKGVYRSRVELILALCGVREADSKQIVDWLFGGPRKQSEDGTRATGGRGVLRFANSEAKAKAGPGASGADVSTRTHIAIDRFTGGVIDGGLFKVEAITYGATLAQQITWQGAGEPPASVRNLLHHVARDINDGLVGVGGNVGRGYGWLTFQTEQEQPTAVDVDALIALASPPVDSQQDSEAKETAR